MKMAKSFKKILALTITLVMTLAVMYVPASADVTDNVFWGKDAAKQFSNANIQTGIEGATLESFKEKVTAAKFGISTNLEGLQNNKYYDGSDNFAKTINQVLQEDGETKMTFHYNLKALDWHGYTEINDEAYSGKLSSGQGGVGLRARLQMLWGEANGNILKLRDGNIAYPEYKPETVAYSLYAAGTRFYNDGISVQTETVPTTLNIYVRYNDGTLISHKGVSLEKDKLYFFTHTADKGKYITELTIDSISFEMSVILDDLSFLFNKFPSSVEIDSPTTIAEPQYNASTTVQLTPKALDTDGETELTNAPLSWSVTGNGATIDENGLLKLKRSLADSITGPVTVTAMSGDAKATKEITVTETAPYYGNIGSSLTDYTCEEFKADLKTATYQSVVNRETPKDSDWYTQVEGTYNQAGLVNNITNTEGLNDIPEHATCSVTLKALKNDGSMAQDNKIRYQLEEGRTDTDVPVATLARDLTDSYQGYYSFDFDENGYNIQQKGLRLTKLGMALSQRGDATPDLKYTVYLDGDTKGIVYEIENVWAGDAKDVFFGYEAPEGRSIDKIEFETDGYVYLDDFAFIFDTSSLTEKVFSTDAAQDNVISEIADAAGAKQIHVAVPASEIVSGGQLILAAYDNDGLLGVGYADSDTGRAVASIPDGKTVTKIKMFVWDSLTGLNPLSGTVYEIK